MSTDPIRFRRVMDVFDSVCELDGDERSRTLAARCAGDPSLMAAVLAMLQHDDVVARSLRERPTFDAAALLAEVGAFEDTVTAAPCERLPVPGERIGRYVIGELLGKGGMGVVFGALDPELQREVAVKVSRVRCGSCSSLVNEARALARVNHPNVVRVHDIGSYEGDVFVAMELVHGRTLREWLVARPRSVREILEVFVAAGRGLAAAHAVGLVHRDFKPENVLIGDDGHGYVVDFGLASAPGSAEDSGGAGTPAYMAPEQHEGGELGAHTDQFSFCVALHEALFGRRPFAWHVGGTSIGPAVGTVPSSVRAAVLRGLAIEPRRRHRSMDALLDKLDAGRHTQRRTRPSARVRAWTH